MQISAVPGSPGRSRGLSRHLGRRLAALLPLALLAAAMPARAWVDTATQALPLAGLATAPLARDSMPLRLAVSLKLQNQDGLTSFLGGVRSPGSPAYGAKLTPAQFSAAYAPSPEQAQMVADYLKASGFTNIAIAPNRLLVTADGTAALARNAFNTPIAMIAADKGMVYANTHTAQVPDALGGTVLAVLGLQSAIHPQLHKLDVKPAATSPFGTGTVKPLDIKDFPTAYDAHFTPTASTYAIFMDGDLSVVLSDLRKAETNNGLPQAPVSIVYTDSKGPIDPDGDGEWDLDSQSSRGIAGSVGQMIWYSPSALSTDAVILDAFNRWVTDDIAVVANSSFGDCEIGARYSGEEKADDQVFMEAAAQGQTFFNAIGDTGAACSIGLVPNGTPDGGTPQQSYPSASPWVVAVGGTTLYTNDDDTYGSERAWVDGGGGLSLTEPEPSWQALVVGGPVGSLANTLNLRSCPDMAMDAAASSGANTVVAGQVEPIGGTSLSSPLATGTFARLQATYGNKLGFIAPILYAQEYKGLEAGSYATNITGFHDITTGFNGLYGAKAGWDYTTGVGTVDICQLATLLGPSGANSFCFAVPTAALSASVASGAAPLTVAFSAAGSTEPTGGGTITSYTFSFGDGSASVTQAGASVSHVYQSAGSYSASVVVQDSNGQHASAQTPVQVTVAPPAAPTALTATAGTKSVSLAWKAVTGAASYNVYSGTSSTALKLSSSGVKTNSATVSALTTGTTYYFQVTAVGSSGAESAKSNTASAKAK